MLIDKPMSELIKGFRDGSINPVDVINESYKNINNHSSSLNTLISVRDKTDVIKELKRLDPSLPLYGFTYVLKDSYVTTELPTTCASKILDGYYSPYDATVHQKLKKAGAILIAKGNQDAWGHGTSTENSDYGMGKNPWDPTRVVGGSSGGPAAAVSMRMCNFAIGEDTGGSIRNPASHCGIVGIKPSYGRVSRYGVIDLAMSLDQVGPLAQDVYGAALLLGVIAGHSDSDSTTFEEAVPDYNKNLTLPKLIKLGLSPEFEKLCSNKKIYALIKKKAEELAKKIGGEIKKVQLKYTPLGVQTYYPLVYTEFFSGTRKFDGRRFGKKIEDSCGEEVLRRILGGKEISRAEFHGTYYRKALKAKELIKKDFETAFGEVDFILSPVTPELPYILGHKITPEEDYALDAFTIPANLAGICAGVVPLGRIDGLPVGLQVMGAAFAEERLIALMNAVSI